VSAEVGDTAEVYVDGGLRRGVHALAAAALGARAVFLGRAPLYALVADGSRGVTRLVEELTGELEEALRLCGSTTLRGLPGDLLMPR
jgi:4-hydroxymandelate oxidase